MAAGAQITDDGRLRLSRDEKGVFIELTVRGTGGSASFRRYLAVRELERLVSAASEAI